MLLKRFWVRGGNLLHHKKNKLNRILRYNMTKHYICISLFAFIGKDSFTHASGWENTTRDCKQWFGSICYITKLKYWLIRKKVGTTIKQTNRTFGSWQKGSKTFLYRSLKTSLAVVDPNFTRPRIYVSEDQKNNIQCELLTRKEGDWSRVREQLVCLCQKWGYQNNGVGKRKVEKTSKELTMSQLLSGSQSKIERAQKIIRKQKEEIVTLIQKTSTTSLNSQQLQDKLSISPVQFLEGC